jgi:hypothetical protein
VADGNGYVKYYRGSNQPEVCAGDHAQTIIGSAEPLLLIVDSYRMDGLAVRVRSRGRERHDLPVVGERCPCSEKQLTALLGLGGKGIAHARC